MKHKDTEGRRDGGKCALEIQNHDSRGPRTLKRPSGQSSHGARSEADISHMIGAAEATTTAHAVAMGPSPRRLTSP